MGKYTTGTFVSPTLFEAVLGPFPSGTPVQLRFTALDTAGNPQSVIPNEAIGWETPPAIKSVARPRVPNPLFAVNAVALSQSLC